MRLPRLKKAFPRDIFHRIGELARVKKHSNISRKEYLRRDYRFYKDFLKRLFSFDDERIKNANKKEKELFKQSVEQTKRFLSDKNILEFFRRLFILYGSREKAEKAILFYRDLVYESFLAYNGLTANPNLLISEEEMKYRLNLFLKMALFSRYFPYSESVQVLLEQFVFNTNFSEKNPLRKNPNLAKTEEKAFMQILDKAIEKGSFLHFSEALFSEEFFKEVLKIENSMFLAFLPNEIIDAYADAYFFGHKKEVIYSLKFLANFLANSPERKELAKLLETTARNFGALPIFANIFYHEDKQTINYVINNCFNYYNTRNREIYNISETGQNFIASSYLDLKKDKQ